MSPTPQTDITSGPTRAELLAAIQDTNAKLAILTAGLLNVQTQVTELAETLAAAGMEPGILGAILTAARTDLG